MIVLMWAGGSAVVILLLVAYAIRETRGLRREASLNVEVRR